MLTVLLKILSILGIILLVLLGVLLAVVLLVLFFPVAYKLKAKRWAQEGESDVFLTKIQAKANWLFGLVRVRYSYPEPGKPTVKLLWISLLRDENGDKDGENKKKKSSKTKKAEEPSRDEEKASAGEKLAAEEKSTAEGPSLEPPEDPQEEPSPDPPKSKESILEKIKCTFWKICDKIKTVKENLTFYNGFLFCDDTKGLMEHGFRRLAKILRGIRPRKLKADVRFGTGSPDTTGYALGVYGILSPHLGRKVNITPDFTEKVLEGEIFAAGHITVFRLLWHGIMLALDKRFWRLYRKLKAKGKSEEKIKKARKARKWRKDGK